MRCERTRRYAGDCVDGGLLADGVVAVAFWARDCAAVGRMVEEPERTR